MATQIYAIEATDAHSITLRSQEARDGCGVWGPKQGCEFYFACYFPHYFVITSIRARVTCTCM
jgi:hypothetical protein